MNAPEIDDRCPLCAGLVLATPELLAHEFDDVLGVYATVAKGWRLGADGRRHWGRADGFARGACGEPLPKFAEEAIGRH